MSETKDVRPKTLSGEEILTWTRNQERAHSYRYKPNSFGWGGLVFFALVFIALAVLLAIRSHLAYLVHIGGFLLLLSLAAFSLFTLVHWTLFSVRNYVVAGNEGILIGRGSTATVIPTAAIQGDNLQLDRPMSGKGVGVGIEVDGHLYTIYVVGVFVMMRTPRVFLAEMLEYIVINQGGSVEAPEEVSEKIEEDKKKRRRRGAK